MVKGIRELPRLHIETEQIMKKVDGKRDLVGFPSSLNGVGYATDGRDALIITSHGGYLRIGAENLKTFIKEMQWIDEEIERRSRD